MPAICLVLHECDKVNGQALQVYIDDLGTGLCLTVQCSTRNHIKVDY